MKRILVAAVIVLAATSLVVGRAGGDSAGNQGGNDGQTVMSNCGTLTFITESLPDFTVGVHANFDIEAVGGTPPYRFEITGGALPAGLKLKKNGTIKGTPTQVDDTVIFVRLTDSAGCSLTQAFAVRVNPAP